jgi:cold shock CspA family protein
MSKGTVKFFNETKGFGFISEEETNKTVLRTYQD